MAEEYFKTEDVEIERSKLKDALMKVATLLKDRMNSFSESNLNSFTLDKLKELRELLNVTYEIRRYTGNQVGHEAVGPKWFFADPRLVRKEREATKHLIINNTSSLLVSKEDAAAMSLVKILAKIQLILTYVPHNKSLETLGKGDVQYKEACQKLFDCVTQLIAQGKLKVRAALLVDVERPNRCKSITQEFFKEFGFHTTFFSGIHSAPYDGMQDEYLFLDEIKEIDDATNI